MAARRSGDGSGGRPHDTQRGGGGGGGPGEGGAVPAGGRMTPSAGVGAAVVQTIESARRRASGRVPPHNLEAEESLLGAMLLSRDAITAAVEAHVESSDF